MTCTIDRNKLAEAMSAVVKVVGSKDFHPAWQCVRLQMVKGHLCIAATDGTLWLNLTIEASGDMESVCINAGRFKDAVTSLTAELVGLQIEGGSLRLFAGKGKRSLPIVAVDDFPQRDFEASSMIPMDAATLKDVFAFVSPHIGEMDDPVTAGCAAIFLHDDEGRLRAVGTDKNQIASVDLGEAPGETTVSIPGRMIDLARDLLCGDVEIGLTERAIELRWLGGRLLGPQIEQPISKELILKALKHHVTFAKEGEEPFSVSMEASALLGALRGVRALGNVDSASRGKRVKMSLNGTATLSTDSPEGSAEDVFEADLSEAREIEIGFSSSRMERVLRSFGDRVLTVTMRDPRNHMKFEAAGLPDRVAVLMPLQV